MNLELSKRFLNKSLVVRLICGATILCGVAGWSEDASAQSASRRRAPPVRRTKPTPPVAPAPAAVAPPPIEEYPNQTDSNIEPMAPLREAKRAPDTLWITPAGRFSAQGDFTYATSKRDVRDAVNVKQGEFTQTQTRFDVNGEFGINRNIAVRAGTSYQTIANDWAGSVASNISSSTKATGVGDFIAGARALYSRDQFLMAGEFNVGISPADGRIAAPSSEGNSFSGGFSINPKIGGAYSLGRSGWIGGLLSYNYRLERKVIQASGGSSTITGGSEISPHLFYEYQFNNIYLNPSFQYVSVADSTTSVGNGATGVSSGSRALYIYGFEGGIYPIPNLRLSAAYSLTSVPDLKVLNTTELSNYLHSFHLSARMQF